MGIFDKKKEGLLCPYTALKEVCVKDKCPKWTKIQMENPQDGSTIDQWACGDTWIPILLVELSQKMVRMDATVESHRNNSSKQNEQLLDTIVKAENINIGINKKLQETFETIKEEVQKQNALQLGKALANKELNP